MVSVDVKHHVYVWSSELRSCVKVEVAVPNKPYGFWGRKATLNCLVLVSRFGLAVRR